MSNEPENCGGTGEQAFEFDKYVLMPHSPYNFIICVSHDKKFKQTRWSVIEKCLTGLKENILNSKGDGENIFMALKTCIETYNPNLRCNFNLLEDLCHYMTSSDIWRVEDVFFSIIEAALKIPKLFPESLMLLRTGQNAEVELTQEKAHCLLANAFLCTFPKRNGHAQYKNYPRINFIELFDDSSNMGTNSWQASARNAKLEKLKCFMNYFSRMGKSPTASSATETIIYERRALLFNELLYHNNSMQNFSGMTAYPSQSSSEGSGRLHVDFANKFVGGGTLGNGSAMEEVKFVTCPALVVAQLFVECLDDRDVLLVHGFEQFSTHTGYSSTFEFEGDFQDDIASDNHIVAMDAHRYQRFEIWKQFEKKNIDRDINKCLCAFKLPKDPKLPVRKVIFSGKWGCGVFNGHPQLKCLIQWMAASLCEVPLELNTFGDTQLANEMNHLADILQISDCKVGEVYPLIIEYGRSLKHSRSNPDNISLVEFIIEKRIDQMENPIVSPFLAPESDREQQTTLKSSLSIDVKPALILETEKIGDFVSVSSEDSLPETVISVPKTAEEILEGEINTSANVSENLSGLQFSTENKITLVEENMGERTDIDKLGSIATAPTKEHLNAGTLKTDSSTDKTERLATMNWRTRLGTYITPLIRIIWSGLNAPFRMLMFFLNTRPDTKSQQKLSFSEGNHSQENNSILPSPSSKSIALKKSQSKPFGIKKLANAIWSFITFQTRRNIPKSSNHSESEYSDQD